jgi:hypothetical protein
MYRAEMMMDGFDNDRTKKAVAMKYWDSHKTCETCGASERTVYAQYDPKGTRIVALCNQCAIRYGRKKPDPATGRPAARSGSTRWMRERLEGVHRTTPR